MTVTSRICTKCVEDKPLEEFSVAPRGKYGRKASCKACDATRHAKLTEGREPKKRGRARQAPKDPSDHKTCRRCGVTKTYAEFSLSRKETASQNAVYRSDCKECCATRARAWFDDNAQRANETRRRHHLKKSYGLTVAEYEKILKEQGGVCAICNKPERMKREGKALRMPVDHDHLTGKLRGLLCHTCNRAIGLLQDDVIVLRRAISYLLRHRREQEE
jgi:hypothetical protein